MLLYCLMRMKIARNISFLLKNRQKSSIMRVMLAFFHPKGKLFFQLFLNNFVEKKKLYNICEIQFGPSSNDWAAAETMKKIRVLFFQKIATHRQYLANKMNFIHWKIEYKYIILFSFSRSIFWYITLKVSLIFCYLK